MSKTTSAEFSLINDSEFLEELEQFEAPPRHDGFDGFDELDGLESGLPVHAGAPAIPEPYAETYATPDVNPYDEPVDAQAPAERHIPLVAAALVIAACLTAGAATAAFIFQDQLTRITATRPASR